MRGVRLAVSASLLAVAVAACGEASDQEKFVQLCESRGGELGEGWPESKREDTFQCFVKYGKRRYEAPMNPWDGGFNPIELRENREECRLKRRGAYGAADADGDGDLSDVAASSGRVSRFVWHADTGICEERRKALGLMKTRSGKVKKVPRSRCEPAYPNVCIPSPPPDLECDDKQVPEGPFRAKDEDPHRLDSNKDGSACEPDIPDAPSSPSSPSVPDTPNLPDYDIPGIPGE